MRLFALGAGIHPQGFKLVFRQDNRQQPRILRTALRPANGAPRTTH
jgi:hypothetical protein